MAAVDITTIKMSFMRVTGTETENRVRANSSLYKGSMRGYGPMTRSMDGVY